MTISKFAVLGIIAIMASGCMATNPYRMPSPTTRAPAVIETAETSTSPVCQDKGFDCYIEANQWSPTTCTAIIQRPGSVDAEQAPCRVQLQAQKRFYELTVDGEKIFVDKDAYDGVPARAAGRYQHNNRYADRNDRNYRYLEGSLHEAAPVQTTITYDYRTQINQYSRAVYYTNCKIRIKTPDRARFNDLYCQIVDGQFGEKWIQYNHQGEQASFPLKALNCRGFGPPVVDTPFFKFGLSNVNSSASCTFRGPDPFL